MYDENEMVALTDAVLDFWLTAGKYTTIFEMEFAKWIGVKYANIVNSGSSANLIAISVLTAKELGERRIKRGDEVITVACGFPTTIAPIIQVGAIPVFVDVTIPEYNIDVTKLEEALSEKTKAVIVAHTLGNPFQIDKVKAFCEANNLWLIEDNCDSLGAEYTINGECKKTGTWGDIGTSSFYPPHHITMGEGGCVYTNSAILNKLIISYRDWGRDCVCPSGKDNCCGKRFQNEYDKLPLGYDHKYVYSHLGYNLKATDLQAAIGIEQLKKLPEFVRARRNNWKSLDKLLKPLEGKVIFPQEVEKGNASWFGYLLTLKSDAKKTRREILIELEKRNIQTRLLFSGNILYHPCFEEMENGIDYRMCGSLDNTNYIMENSFWVGVYPGMKKGMIEYIAKSLIEIIGE